jgi:hypothetical protein
MTRPPTPPTAVVTEHCRFGAVLRKLCDVVLALPVEQRESTWRLLADHVQQLTAQIARSAPLRRTGEAS